MSSQPDPFDDELAALFDHETASLEAAIPNDADYPAAPDLFPERFESEARNTAYMTAPELDLPLPLPSDFNLWNEAPNTAWNSEGEVSKQMHACSVCDKVYASRATLMRHLRFHSGERPYSCQHCNKNFAQKGDLKVHARSHTGETPFECRQCGKQFSQFTGLKYHRRVHSGERPVQCSVCGRAFVHTGDLNVHMRTHTGEKPFGCTVCHRRFTQRGSVRLHMRRRHNQIITIVPRTPDPGMQSPARVPRDARPNSHPA